MAKQESKGKAKEPRHPFRLHLYSYLSRQDSNLPTFASFLYLLSREGPLILPFSIINRNKPIFSYSLFVTFWGQLLQQDRSRCRSRWENLDRGQDWFYPIKFLIFFVSSPFDTWPYNNVAYYIILRWYSNRLPHYFGCTHPSPPLKHKRCTMVKSSWVKLYIYWWI